MNLVKLIRKYRKFAYNSARTAGDIQAVLNGDIVGRFMRKRALRTVARPFSGKRKRK